MSEKVVELSPSWPLEFRVGIVFGLVFTAPQGTWTVSYKSDGYPEPGPVFEGVPRHIVTHDGGFWFPDNDPTDAYLRLSGIVEAFIAVSKITTIYLGVPR